MNIIKAIQSLEKDLYYCNDMKSKILIEHLITRSTFYDYEIELVKILAKAHGWTLEIEE